MTVHEKMREFVKDKNYKLGDIFTRQEITEWFNTKYPKTNKSTLNCQIYLATTNDHNRIHYSASEKHDLLFKVDSYKYRLYNQGEDPTPIYKQSYSIDNSSMPESSKEEGFEYEREFAYEKDLQQFLSKNLDIIDSNYRLYQNTEINIDGLEVNAGGRFIDMLLVDKEDNFIVVELKVSKSYDRVIGQLLRYMGWIRQNFAEDGKKVSGIIIGRKISEDLIIAATEIENVSLMEYSIEVKLKTIAPA